VPEKEWTHKGKICSTSGSFLRQPVFRVKVDDGVPILRSSVNFANRTSTEATWQVDEAHNSLTNGNFTKTGVT